MLIRNCGCLLISSLCIVRAKLYEVDGNIIRTRFEQMRTPLALIALEKGY